MKNKEIAEWLRLANNDIYLPTKREPRTSEACTWSSEEVNKRYAYPAACSGTRAFGAVDAGLVLRSLCACLHVIPFIRHKN